MGPAGHHFSSCTIIFSSIPTSTTSWSLIPLTLSASNCSPAPFRLLPTPPPGQALKRRHEGVTYLLKTLMPPMVSGRAQTSPPSFLCTSHSLGPSQSGLSLLLWACLSLSPTCFFHLQLPGALVFRGTDTAGSPLTALLML